MKKLLFLLSGLSLILLSPVSVLAESKTEDVAYIENSKDIMFEVNWDIEQPEVKFISPGGKEYDPGQESEGTLTVYTANAMYYLINSAEGGMWTVVYDEKSNQQVNILLKNYETKLMIQSFEVGQVTNNQLETKFYVKDYRESLYYNYRISAVAEKQGEERILAEGGAYTNQDILLNINLNQLGSHNGYMLKLYVWYTENETDIFDQVYSEPFNYVNSNSSDTYHDYQIVIQPEIYKANILWEELPYNADGCLFGMFVDNESEPQYYDKFDSDQKELDLLYGEEPKKLRFEFSTREYDIYTKPLVKTVDLENSPLIEMTTEEVINRRSINLKYSGFHGQLGQISVNDKMEEVVFDSEGELSIALTEDWNEVVVTCDAGNGITFRWERKIFVDHEAPILKMLEDYTGISTDEESITIAGTAFNYNLVTVGENQAEIDDSGRFTYTYPLQEGLNTIPVVAMDVAGNETMYTATVTKTGPNAIPAFSDTTRNESTSNQGKSIAGDFLPLIVSSVICAIMIACALVLWKKKTK